MQKLLLKNFQSLGDQIVLTRSVSDLKAAYPQDYELHVSTSHMEVWDNNPNVIQEHISAHGSVDGARSVAVHYPAINQSNRLPRHFIESFHRYLELVINKPIPVREFRGDIYLSERERNEYPVKDGDGNPLRYWIVVNGGKQDFSAKWPVPAHMKRAIEILDDSFKRRMKFVQIGAVGHIHHRLNHPSVIDRIGQTNIRDVFQLVYHCEGIICPMTFMVHASAAVPLKRAPFPVPDNFAPNTPENLRPGQPLRPCVVIAGGREPAHWEKYPGSRFLENVGALPCCAYGGCWRSRAQKIGDGDGKDSQHLCLNPVNIEGVDYAKCISMIGPEKIAAAVLEYYEGGALSLP